MYVPEDWNTPARLSKTTENDPVVKAAMATLDNANVYSVTYHKKDKRYRIMFARSRSWNSYYIKDLIDAFAEKVKDLNKVVSVPNPDEAGYSNYYRVDVKDAAEPFTKLKEGVYNNFENEYDAWNFALKHCASNWDVELGDKKPAPQFGWYRRLIIKKS